MQGDVGLAARGEFGEVVGHLVHEGQLAFLDQRPDRGAGEHLGLREHLEQRAVVGGLRARVRAGLAVAAEQQQLAVPRQRDLRAGIAALRDVLLDQRVEMIDLPRRDAVLCEVACGKRIGIDFDGRIHGVSP